MTNSFRRIHIFSYVFIFLHGLSGAAWAFDKYPSFLEWRATMENAFKILQGQEDKLLDPTSAKTIVVWPKEWRTSVRPEDEVLEIEKQHDPAAVRVAEDCRQSLLAGATLLVMARRGEWSPGNERDDRMARIYIQMAEACENGLNIPHPANGFRARFIDQPH